MRDFTQPTIPPLDSTKAKATASKHNAMSYAGRKEQYERIAVKVHEMLVPTALVQSKEIAFYHPGPIWHHAEKIKTMILFFDGIGISLPNYRHRKGFDSRDSMSSLADSSSS